MLPRSLGFTILVLLVSLPGCYMGPYDEDEPPVKSLQPKSPTNSISAGKTAAKASKVAENKKRDEKTEETVAPDGSKKRRYHGISFMIPKDWDEIRLSPAQQTVINSKYRISTEHGDLELTLTNMGGGWESNLDRWAMQMGKPGSGDRSSQLLGGADSHWIDVEGDYISKFNDEAGPHNGFRLVGGVIVIKPQDFTLKLLGPKKAIDDYHDTFMEFVKTATVGD